MIKSQTCACAQMNCVFIIFAWITVLITVPMNHYVGHCQWFNLRFAIEIHLQLFSPYCCITVYDFESKRAHRVENRKFNFQSREHPTHPDKEWRSNHKTDLRAVCYRMNDSCETRGDVRKMLMYFEISRGSLLGQRPLARTGFILFIINSPSQEGDLGNHQSTAAKPSKNVLRRFEITRERQSESPT